MNVEDLKRRALIVEDEFLIAEGLRIQLEAMGYDVCGVAETAHQAVDMAMDFTPNFVLMDVRLKGREDGVDAALAIHEKLNGTSVIFVTGSREQATIDRIAMDHPAATLFKPVSTHQLKRTIAEVVA